jgi:glycosyltransferase involved in cell wall biosynthesis
MGRHRRDYVVTISVIIPTLGRDSLADAKESCAGADEIIVIENQDGDHGYSARTRGIQKAAGSHLAFLDDDDVYTAGAIELMREAACDVPVIFKMDHHQHGVMWRQPFLEFGNVGTPMFLVPNRPELLGEWKEHAPGFKEPGGDFSFISGCVEKMGGVMWRDEIVCTVRPDFPTISIVTPWLNHLELADGYKQAISRRSPRDELIVVDDGSDPPIPFATLRNEDSLGFGSTCNCGLYAAKSDIVLFLNNDVLARDPYWLEPIREAVEPGVLIGAQLRDDPHGSVDGTPMPYLDGWCLAGMRDDLLEIGGFDEDFQPPAYFEDNDLCLRARMAGMTLREVRVPLHHIRNATMKPDDPRVRAATLANRERFMARAREALTLAD